MVATLLKPVGCYLRVGVERSHDGDGGPDARVDMRSLVILVVVMVLTLSTMESKGYVTCEMYGPDTTATMATQPSASTPTCVYVVTAGAAEVSVLQLDHPALLAFRRANDEMREFG
ncbi:hypothetical protein PHYSODRAFT_338885 [Phytophthora sojae]|uniref:Uncharacterized protein n=1 Tax=Phytophthora sojae (strain P6497) TaxID=1094619 RepID=G5A3K0_PHYSP|nr:hypothetical protein PHYSODRAFT_338885 [Phytophthora sojae]EGZ10216.1 hypothetical protein PHYSODRAFT_338885 [Phytophthora sojae]|eukprot:XP_009535077.1 hypothetical protein PHYSODRAFT_338885 [Phytophthora sojae]